MFLTNKVYPLYRSKIKFVKSVFNSDNLNLIMVRTSNLRFNEKWLYRAN